MRRIKIGLGSCTAETKIPGKENLVSISLLRVFLEVGSSGFEPIIWMAEPTAVPSQGTWLVTAECAMKFLLLFSISFFLINHFRSDYLTITAWQLVE